MRHPLWILNSTLLVFVISAFGFIVFSRQKLPAREGIEPEEYIQPEKEMVSKITISKIYENDLFGTYRKEYSEPRQQNFVNELPSPPSPQTITPLEAPKQEFVDPLNITLKGIIIILSDEGLNRAIIADNKTNIETVYKIGELIEDAQLVRILHNKVMFLRSNGQQEVLYLREKDAQEDPSYVVIKYWETVVQKIADNDYLINPKEFVERIKNLAQFIDILDLTTVYQKGKSIGCRIGQLEDKSLGIELGLISGDIIKTINGIPATDTAHRFKIYKNIVALHEDQTVTIELLRNGQMVDLSYTLKNFKTEQESLKENQQKETSAENIKKEQIKMLQQKYKFAPTISELRAKERRNMMQRGRQPQKRSINAK